MWEYWCVLIRECVLNTGLNRMNTVVRTTRENIDGRGIMCGLLSDGQRLVSCSGDQYLRVVDINTGTEVYAKDAGQQLR